MSSPMAIRPIDTPSEAFRKVAKWKRVAHMQLDLQIGLSSIGGEGSIADDESHNVPYIELSHSADHSTVFRVGTEPRGTRWQFFEP